MSEALEILVVDDESNMRRVLAALVRQAGHHATCCASAEEALERLPDADPRLVLSDLKMPGMDGMELLSRLRSAYPEIPVVMVTAFGSIDVAVEAMKRGAHDFITKPFDRDRVLGVIDRALNQARRVRLDFQGPLEPRARCGIVGRSPAIEEMRSLIERAAPSTATILISGETGTGKELVAEAVHRLSSRAEGPLVRINCGALPEALVESELFGHEKGAFTGADEARLGRFELADRGTLFLDEVGELPLPAQVKLLRVLQDGRVDRLGARESREVDVRLVAATNRDLDRAAADGAFRQDLLFRLRVIEIRVPALAERREDVPLLVDFFVDKHSRRLGVEPPSVADAAYDALLARRWAGNVRELENAVERALVLGRGETLTPEDFEAPGEPLSTADPAPSADVDLKQAAREAASRTERRLISQALTETEGNVTQAAKRLGLSRRGLQLKMKELGLRPGPDDAR